jgi:hypothetical protein
MSQRLRSERVSADLMRAADPLDAAWVAEHATAAVPTLSLGDEVAVAHSPHRRANRWSRVGAIAVTVAAVVALAVVLSRHGTTRTAAPPIPAAACDPHRFTAPLPTTHGVEMDVVFTYTGASRCSIGALPPALLLVGADGTIYGRPQDISPSLRSDFHLPAPTPPTPQMYLNITPGDQVTVPIIAFLNCRIVKPQTYTLHVYFGRPASPDPSAGAVAGVGEQVGTSTLCLTYSVGQAGYPILTRPGVAAPSLLSRLPARTGPVLVATGTTSGRAWRFYASVTAVRDHPSPAPYRVAGYPAPVPLVSGAGLSTGLVLKPSATATRPSAGPGPTGDPRRMPVISLSRIGPIYPGFDGEIILGVTSVPAAAIHISRGSGDITVVPHQVAAIHGLYFFVTQEAQAERIDAVTAVDANGNVLAQATLATIPNEP